jgi:hypothetical protein
MDVIELLSILYGKEHQLDEEFLDADRGYYEARKRRDENSMAYWWDAANKAHKEGDAIRSAIKIIKIFSKEGG